MIKGLLGAMGYGEEAEDEEELDEEEGEDAGEGERLSTPHVLVRGAGGCVRA